MNSETVIGDIVPGLLVNVVGDDASSRQTVTHRAEIIEKENVKIGIVTNEKIAAGNAINTAEKTADGKMIDLQDVTVTCLQRGEGHLKRKCLARAEEIVEIESVAKAPALHARNESQLLILPIPCRFFDASGACLNGILNPQVTRM